MTVLCGVFFYCPVSGRHGEITHTWKMDNGKICLVCKITRCVQAQNSLQTCRHHHRVLLKVSTVTAHAGVALAVGLETKVTFGPSYF